MNQGLKSEKQREKILYRIRIKNVEQVRCCPSLKKFIDKVVVAQKTPAGIFVFSFEGSSGFKGSIIERHSIVPQFVDVIAQNVLPSP